MRIFLAVNLISSAFSFNPVPTSPLLAWSSICRTGCTSRSMPVGTSRTNKYPMLMMSASEEQSGGGLTRKTLLEGVTKASGILAVGTFLQRGLVAGVDYHGNPDLTGKTAVITGGNTGLGKETAVRLAQLGADVTIACRSPDRAAAALEDIKAQAPGAKVVAMPLDLASLDSVASFAKSYASLPSSSSLSSAGNKLDILVNNAGVMAIPERESTRDGFEKQFGINHLGHFRLTSLLMPKLLKSPDARVVSVSSSAHLFATAVDWDDLNAQAPDAYGPWKAYGLSKLSNILFTKALQKRLDAKGASVTCTALHPGACRTELGRYLFDPTQPMNPLVYPVLAAATLVTKSAREGAQTQIACAVEPSLVKNRGSGGLYFIGPKITKMPSELARDPEAAERMWTASEKMVGKFAV